MTDNQTTDLPDGHVMYNGVEWRPLRDGESVSVDSVVYVSDDTYCLINPSDAVPRGCYVTNADVLRGCYVTKVDAANSSMAARLSYENKLVARHLIRVPVTPVELVDTSPAQDDRIVHAVRESDIEAAEVDDRLGNGCTAWANATPDYIKRLIREYLRAVVLLEAAHRRAVEREATAARFHDIAGEDADEATLAVLAADPRIADALAGDE